MTVIILARATDGFVVTADGRTCTNDLPKDIDDDCAVKVHVHRFGPGGYITASSGRARIGGVPIADVETRFVAELEETHGIPSPKEFAEFLRAALEEYNLEHSCDCDTHIGDVRIRKRSLPRLFRRARPRVRRLPRGARVRVGQEGTRRGRRLPVLTWGESSTKSSGYLWCHCKTHVEGDLQWLCVPFGPGRTAPGATTISWDHEAKTKLDTITRYPVVQGELATKYDYRIPVICETRRQAAQFASDGSYGLLVDALVSSGSRTYRPPCRSPGLPETSIIQRQRHPTVSRLPHSKHF